MGHEFVTWGELFGFGLSRRHSSIASGPGTDGIGFFLFHVDVVFFEWGEAFSAEAEFLGDGGMWVVGVGEFLQEDEEIDFGGLDLQIGVFGEAKGRVRATDADGADGVDFVFFGQ